MVREPVKEAFALSSPKLEDTPPGLGFKHFRAQGRVSLPIPPQLCSSCKEPGPGTSDGVWQRLLQESLRAEQAELRLLEASTDGVEARKRGPALSQGQLLFGK